VSTPCLAIAAATTSPIRSSPIAPIACTSAPSLARSTPVPAAVPAAVARISVSRAPPWPGLTGLRALRVIMLEALPLDDERDLEAQIEISFWGRALGNPELRTVQNAEFDRFARRLRALLTEAEKLGELRAGTDIDLAAHQLLVLIDGLSAQRVLYAGRVTAQRQRMMLDRLLDSFRPPG
jgi:hypothetical protein